jgi:hypothetical protein
MRRISGTIEVDWGHLLLLLFIAGWIVGYLIDTRATSLSIHNLLLVQPTAIIALVLCLIVLPQCFRRVEAAEAAALGPDARAERQRALRELGKIALLAAAFGAFTTSLETVGFDVACWLFTAIGLYICGERRWWVVLLFTTFFTVALIYGYRAIIPFPFPLRVL